MKQKIDSKHKKTKLTLCLVRRNVDPCLGSNLLCPDVELHELLPKDQDMLMTMMMLMIKMTVFVCCVLGGRGGQGAAYK